MYLCPKCGSPMVCVSSNPSLEHYKCSSMSCHYASKSEVFDSVTIIPVKSILPDKESEAEKV